MKTQFPTPRTGEQGYALMLTLVFISVSVVLLASMCKWTSGESMLTTRNNSYNNSVAAAESATEVAIAQMNRDFRHQALSKDVNIYNGTLPGKYASDWAPDYQFGDNQGNANKTGIICTGWQIWTNLDTEFKGLYGMINTYEVTATAKKVATLQPVSAAVHQNFQLTAIPVFQFAIFYALDLEINPSPIMKVTGKVHSNMNIYTSPTTNLEFMDSVSASGKINHFRHPDDPQTNSWVSPIYDTNHLENVSSLTLPIGTDNNPTNVSQIVQVPPVGEDPASEMGQQRFYNKSDLIVTTTDKGVTVRYNNNENGTSFTLIPTNSASGGAKSGYSFVKTNATFFDYREQKQVTATEIDVAALTNWMTSAGAVFDVQAQVQNSHHIRSIYVDDQRTVGGNLTAVRVSNGRFLPQDGLTVATSRPLYVQGNFNAPDLTVGSTNTTQAKPASLVGDAITVLSPSWSDTYLASTSNRVATSGTINAAFLAGVVQSTNYFGIKHYSGGVENFPRFLENWGGKTLTYNGSMVVMFASRFATGFWGNNNNIYSPPNRSWAFDTNFLDPIKLPPGTPQVRKLQRGQWSIVAVKN